MRDFAVTAEPAGGQGAFPVGKLPFVIQKHAATRLHYDFRLGWRGVLKSWACAKGPSYVTSDRRLAVEVEDHPIEYGGFEGAIPKGEYGGGTVLVWDQGTWEPLPGTDFDEGLRKGSLKFTLHGEKLRGRWTLVRMGGKAANEAKPNWLLIKERDGLERSASAPGITDEAPNSVITGRGLEQIAAAEDHIWHSHAVEQQPGSRARNRLQQKIQSIRAQPEGKGTAAAKDSRQAHDSKKDPEKPAGSRKGGSKGSAAETTQKNGDVFPSRSTRKKQVLRSAQGDTFSEIAKQISKESNRNSAAEPGFIPPQLATPSDTLPSGPHWLHELKLDGYRMQAHLSSGKAVLYTRTGLDWTHRMHPVASAIEKLPVGEAILDGELVVLAEGGAANFSRLQAAFESGGRDLSYLAFDLLYLDGVDLRAQPLHARKARLESLLTDAAPSLAYSAHLQLEADEVYAHACGLGAEGLISKQADAPYTSGRSDTWLKLKCLQRQEFVIAGMTPPVDGGAGLGALLLGYYADGKLIHCGRCGTGFTHAAARELRQALDPLLQPKPPYAHPLDRFQRRDALWVRPELVAEVQFTSWTDDHQIRHASFQGLRADKPAREVVRESAAVAAPDEADSLERKAEAPKPQAPAKPARSPAKPSPAARLTHPDKILDPATGVTKRALAEFYEQIAPALLAQLAGRPTSIVRCPEGVGKPSFFQKHIKTGSPKSLQAIAIPGEAESYIGLQTPEALAALAQLSVLEFHPWLSTSASIEQPDRLILDLDPDEALPWSTLVESALAIRDLLAELRLKTWVKTTGGKGLHLVAPLEPRLAWPEMKEFAHALAAVIESTDPKRYLIKMTKAARAGRIFVDWMRNERGATAVAAYSPRARAGLRVAVPLAWNELAHGPFSFAVGSFAEWRKRLKKDPWADMRPQPLLPEVVAAVLEQTASARHGGRKR